MLIVELAAHPEHPVLDTVVGAAAEQPCVAVELDICPTAPTTPKIENATAATTKTAVIFFIPGLPFLGFLGGSYISGETCMTKGFFSIGAPLCFLAGVLPSPGGFALPHP